jgi:hypothetical protein
MWIAEIAERAILSVTTSMDVTFRASRVDDEELHTEERAMYPAMVIQAGGGSTPGNTFTHYDIPVTITFATSKSSDPKLKILAGLEDDLRNAIDNGIPEIVTAFNSISAGAGESWYLQGIVDVEGNPVEYETPFDTQTQTLQKIATTMTLKVCGSFRA